MNYPIINPVATGARIKELREQNHLQVSDISRFMGFGSDQAVYKWQRGDTMPSVDKQSWFTSNVDKWLFCNNEESDDPNDFVEEDLVEYFGISHSK